MWSLLLYESFSFTPPWREGLCISYVRELWEQETVFSRVYSEIKTDRSKKHCLGESAIRVYKSITKISNEIYKRTPNYDVGISRRRVWSEEEVKGQVFPFLSFKIKLHLPPPPPPPPTSRITHKQDWRSDTRLKVQEGRVHQNLTSMSISFVPFVSSWLTVGFSGETWFISGYKKEREHKSQRALLADIFMRRTDDR